MLLTLDSVLKSPNPKSTALQEDSDDDDERDAKSRTNINLQNDDLYLQFSSRSHDIGDYLQNAVNEPAEALTRLKASLAKIDNYIRNEVVSQHDSLLNQSDDVSQLEADLKLIRDRVHMIENHIHRIRNGVINPFNDFKHKSKQSLNLQIGETLLRSILRIKKLLSQLNEYFHKNKDMVKSALCISEIMTQINKADMQLNGIEIIDEKRDYIYSVYQQIGDLGKQKLSSGLRSLNQPNIAIGLQVFYNLGHDKLSNIIKIVLQSAAEQCRDNLQNALNVERSTADDIIEASDDTKTSEHNVHKSRSDDKLEQNVSELSVKSALLMRCDKCIHHHLFGNLLQIWNLEKVLRKKNDSLSRAYIELVRDVFHNTLSFWGHLIEIIKEEFERAAKVSSFINNVLVNEYIVIYQMLIDFYHKVESTTSNVDQTLPINQQQKLSKISGFQHRENLIASMDEFKQSFINKCVHRIQEPLNILFRNQEMRRIPTTADMRTLWMTFYNELKNTQDCCVLQVKIANTIYENGCKQMVIHLKKKIVSVTYTTNAGSKSNLNFLNDFRHNIDIFNCIQALYLHISSIIQQRNDAMNKIKLNDESSLYLTKCCNLLYNFDCYVLYYCLRVAWYTLIASLSSAKALSIHCQFISKEILSLVHSGSAMDYVLKQWCAGLTAIYLQFITLHYNICDAQDIQTIAINIAQFIKFLRIFEDEYNVDVVPAILMLQQYKRIMIYFNEKNKDDEFKTLQHLQKENPNLSMFIIYQFILSFIQRINNKEKSLNDLIAMSVDEYITNAFIRKNFFGLFDFNLNNNSDIDLKLISVDIMAISDEQYNLLQIIHSKLKKNINHKYLTEIEKIFQTT